MTITPAIAEKWLTQNLCNRRVRPNDVDRYGRDMAAGSWGLDGTPIKFDTLGNLLDGQHRLMGCVKYKVSFDTFVAFNIDAKAQSVIDTGVKRTLSDILTWAQYTNAALLGSTATLCYRIEKGNGSPSSLIQRPTSSEVLAYLQANPSIKTSLPLGQKIANKVGGPASTWSSFRFFTEKVDLADSDDFIASLVSGTGLVAGDPVLALRNWAANRANAPKTQTSLPNHVWLAFAFLAWNKYRDNVPTQQLIWRSSGNQRMAYPVPH